MLRSWPTAAAAGLAATALLFAAACGGDDDDPATTEDGSPTSTADSSPDATSDGNSLVPPLEGPGRGEAPLELTDFREDPDWQLPVPEDVPAPPADEADERTLNPPADPSCPDEWEVLDRPTEGFKICYPGDWELAAHGYVSSANEEKWWSTGIVRFAGDSRETQLAHVSIYVIPRFTRPFRYTIDCPQPYSITFGGQPAVVCPDFPAESPEAEIVSYHVFREDLDYFVNIATYFTEEDGELTDEVDEAARETAIDIAHTFEFIPVAVAPDEPAETAEPTGSE